MKLTFLGAAGTVTGSRILFEHEHFCGLVDCGLFQGPKDMRELNWLDQPELLRAQCVILTHVHVDHCGYLPRLYRNGFRKRIYCTRPSADLLPVMLMDAAKLQEEDARFANRVRHSQHDPALPLYEQADAIGCKELIYSRPWHEWTPLTDHLSFRFIPSGHILGSGFIQFSFSDGNESRILTLTGDIGGGRSDILRDPESLAETDFLVIESTYGNRSLSRTSIYEQLGLAINKVMARGGTLIIPAFSVGRTQDVLYGIHQLRQQGKIPSVRVYLDSPMSHAVTSIYLKHIEELKNLNGNDIERALDGAVCTPVLSPDDSMLLCMSTEPKIVISASGMLQGGRVLHHLKAKLPDPKSGVLFVGFQTQGTKGRLIKEGLNTIRIHHQDVDIQAEIFSIEGFSAHADSNELVQWMGHFQHPPKLTLVNHGEPEASAALAYRIRNELKWACEIPAMGQTFDLK